MDPNLPYFTNPQKVSSSDKDEEFPDNGSGQNSNLMLTKEPASDDKVDYHTRRGTLTGEERNRYPSPPRGSGPAPGFFTVPSEPPTTTASSAGPPLPPGRIQQPTPLPGNRAPRPLAPATRSNQPTPQPVSSNTMSSDTPALASASQLTTQPSTQSSGPPFPDGPRAGESLPPDLASAVNEIRRYSREWGMKPPSRANLKAKSTGGEIHQYFHGSTGVMRQESRLRQWYGDLNVFPLEWWEFLVWQKPRSQTDTG